MHSLLLEWTPGLTSVFPKRVPSGALLLFQTPYQLTLVGGLQVVEDCRNYYELWTVTTAGVAVAPGPNAAKVHPMGTSRCTQSSITADGIKVRFATHTIWGKTEAGSYTKITHVEELGKYSHAVVTPKRWTPDTAPKGTAFPVLGTVASDKSNVYNRTAAALCDLQRWRDWNMATREFSSNPVQHMSPAVAGSPHACDMTLRVFAQSPSLTVKRAVAANRAASEDLLYEMASQCPEVVAANPTAPQQLLQSFLDSGIENLRRIALANPNCPNDAFDSARTRSIFTSEKMAAATNPNCPSDLLAEWSKMRRSPVLRLTALANPNCPPGALTDALKSTSQDIVRTALANPNCPEQELMRHHNFYPDQRPVIDMNPAVAERFRTVDVVTEVGRERAAGTDGDHPPLSPSTWNGLADNQRESPEEWLYYWVAETPSAPSWLVAELVEASPQGAQVASLFDHPNCPPASRLVIATSRKVVLAELLAAGLTASQLVFALSAVPDATGSVADLVSSARKAIPKTFAVQL